MLELNQLIQLISIAETGTISKAAETLHLSQPALSRSMQRLETELQVPLFIRQKNKLTFNESGELALTYAKKIINEVEHMTSGLQTFERSRHILSMGSCAPAPLWHLNPILSRTYSDMTIQSEVKSAKQLLSGLLNNIYRIIITTEPFNISGILSFPYLEEHLYAALPPEHPLAQRTELSLHDLNGQNALILSNIGFWEEICKQKMPDSLFFVQNDAVTLHELRKSSVLVAFSTDLTIEMAKEMPKEKEGRSYVPLTDPEVNVTYYCNIKETDRDFFASLISYLSPL